MIFFVFHTSVLLLNHANRIKVFPLHWAQEVAAIIQKHCISKQDKADTYPPKSPSYLPICFLAFLFNIICNPVFSDHTEHKPTLCHNMSSPIWVGQNISTVIFLITSSSQLHRLYIASQFSLLYLTQLSQR